MNQQTFNPWLHRFAVLTALATLGLVGLGGLVTSHGVGMAVPDWPTSYGYNMFALPISTWLTGGIFHEHTHRLWASFVGVLVVALARWLGGGKSRGPLILVGVGEIVAGLVLLRLGADWKGAGHFLSGIGGVVLLAGIVWAKNAPAPGRLPLLGWAAFWLVQLQGLLGGLRVVLDSQMVADVRLGTAFGIFHGCLGQGFLVLLAAMALVTSRWWMERVGVHASACSADKLKLELQREGAHGVTRLTSVHRWFLFATILIFVQLLIAATMRHQHAGLAIPDFPLAHGKLWPDLSAEAVAGYNLRRVEVTTADPITAFQIGLQMAHRIVAGLILVAVAVCAWGSRRREEADSCADVGVPPPHVGGYKRASMRLANFWLGLILVQGGLGAWTIWSNKAADVATAHVVVGALSLVTGALGCLIYFRRFPENAPSSAVVESEDLRADRISA